MKRKSLKRGRKYSGSKRKQVKRKRSATGSTHLLGKRKAKRTASRAAGKSRVSKPKRKASGKKKTGSAKRPASAKRKVSRSRKGQTKPAKAQSKRSKKEQKRKVPYRKAPKRKAPKRKAPYRKAPPKTSKHLPAGYEPVLGLPRAALLKMSETLEIAKERMEESFPELEFSHTEFLNDDDTADGELSIRGLDRKSDLDKILAYVGSEFPKPGGYWVSIAFRFDTDKIKKDDTGRYERYRGLYQTSLHWQRLRRIPVHIATAQRVVRAFAERKFRYKTERLVIRIHWNMDDAKPERG